LKRNNAPKVGALFLSESAAELLSLLTMTIPAEELIQTRFIGLEGKFGDCGTALRARPVSLNHLTLESVATTWRASSVLFVSHLPKYYCRRPFRMRQMTSGVP
jgi:hypothetical protein